MGRLWLLLLGTSLLVTPSWADEPPITHPPEVKSELETVLGQPEFVNATKPGLVEQLGQWLYNWLSQMDTDLRAYEFIGQLTRLSYALMWIILIVSFIALGYWIFRVFKHRQWEDDELATGSIEAGDPLHFTSFEAPTLESDQPALQSLLQAWRRLIGKMEQDSSTPDLRAYTNREALATRPDLNPELERELNQLAKAYDRHVFGHLPLPDDQAKAAEAVLDTAGDQLASTDQEERR